MNNLKYGYLLALRVLPIGAQTIFFAMVLSQKGASFTGVIVFFLAGYSVLRGLAPLGLDLEVLRVSSRLTDSAGALNRLFLFTSLRLSILFGSIVSLVTAGLAIAVNTPGNALIGVACTALPNCLVGVLVAYLRSSKTVLKSQAIDAFGTALLPTLICIWLLNCRTLTFNTLVIVFTLSTIMTVGLLFLLAFSQSKRTAPTESIDIGALRENAIAQVLLSLNSRFPTLVTGVFSPVTLVTYVDLGSKIQLVGSTVAWLFGVFQSPIYARDGDSHLSQSSRALIRRSYFWSGCVIVAASGGILAFSSFLATYLGLSFSDFILVIFIFTLIALSEAPVNAFGYALAMTKNSRTISISISIQLAVVFIGVLIGGNSILDAGLAVFFGALARLCFVLWRVKKKGKRVES